MKLFSVSVIPVAILRTVSCIRFQSRPPNAPLIPLPIAFPRLSQWKFSAKVFAIPKAVLIPCARVLPTSFQSTVSRKPFRKVATLFAILLQVFLILSHGMLFSAAFSLLPTIAPISVKSAFFQACLIMSAIPLIFEGMLSVSNISEGDKPPDVSAIPLLLSELLLSSILLIWSKLRMVRFNSSFAFLAFLAELALLFRLLA